eukprot:1286730-Rhodomonas_salina.3
MVRDSPLSRRIRFAYTHSRFARIWSNHGFPRKQSLSMSGQRPPVVSARTHARTHTCSKVLGRRGQVSVPTASNSLQLRERRRAWRVLAPLNFADLVE